MNCVNLVGTLAGEPRPQSDTQTPCCTARFCAEELSKDGQIYRTYIPLEAWGQAAITLGPLQEGTPRRSVASSSGNRGRRQGRKRVCWW
jgi:hypothetical protein